MSTSINVGDSGAPQELQTDHRYFRLHRSISVNHPVHAKVELVTNSVDAMRAAVAAAAAAASAESTTSTRSLSRRNRNRRKRRQQQQQQQQRTLNANPLGKRVEIEEDYVERRLVVRDYATGMTGDKLESAILVVGSHTADAPSSRGLFSSGAKNVSQLGYVLFETIKDDHYSSCFINLAGLGGMIDKDIAATEAHRAKLHLPAGTDGVVVTLDYAEHVQLEGGAVKQFERFRTYFSMRNLLSGDECVVMGRVRDPSFNDAAGAVTEAPAADEASVEQEAPATVAIEHPGDYGRVRVQEDGWSEWFQVIYRHPQGRLEDRYAYQVPNYPDAKVYVELYRATDPLPVPEVYEEDTLQFGYTIASGRTVHEHSALWPDLRTNEEMRYFFGHIRCDHIDAMMEQFDRDGPSAENPAAVIDPNRLAGLNRAHPFVLWMLSIVTEKTRLLVKRLREEFDRDTSVAENDVLDLAGKLAAVGSQIFNQSTHELDWRQNDQARYLRAVHDAESYIFVRQEDLHELYPGENLLDAAAAEAAAASEEDDVEFLFRDDEVLADIEEQATRALDTTTNSAASVTTNDGLHKLRIKDRGDVVEITPDQKKTEEEKAAPRIYTPKVYVDIVYSDDPKMRKRFKYDIDDRVIRITINMRSPCFQGQLTRNPETKQICGCDRVHRELIQTFVTALARLYVDRKMLSAEQRLVTVPNNQAGASLLRYAEELDEATILIEREVYRHLGASCANVEEHLSSIAS